MGLPLFADHVLVRLGDGTQQAANAVLDALEGAFPTHTGRGQTHLGNVWEDPAEVTAEGRWAVAEARPGGVWTAPATSPGVSCSQAFDVRSATGRQQPVPLTGELTAELLGIPRDIALVIGALGGVCQVRELDREQDEPYAVVRLRLTPGGAG